MRMRTILITGPMGAGKTALRASLATVVGVGTWQPGDPPALEHQGVRWQLPIAPGRVLVAATRKAQLADADAVLLVLDVRRSAIAASTIAVSELRDHLAAVAAPGLPVVVAYTHVEHAEALPPAERDQRYNQAGRPTFIDPVEAIRSLQQAQTAAHVRRRFAPCARCGTQIELPSTATCVCAACGATLAVRNGATERIPTAAAAQTGGGGEALVPRPKDPVPTTSIYRRAGVLEPSTKTQPLPLPPGVEVLAVFDDSPIGLRIRGQVPDLGPARLLVTTPVAAAVPGYAEALRRRAASCGGLRHPHILPLQRLVVAESTLIALTLKKSI